MSSGIRSALTKVIDIVEDVTPQSLVGEKGAEFLHAPTTNEDNPPRTRQFFCELVDITHDGNHDPGIGYQTAGVDLVIGYDVEQDTTELAIVMAEDHESIANALTDCGLYGSSSLVDVAGGEEDIMLADVERLEEPSPHYLVRYRIPLTYKVLL